MRKTLSNDEFVALLVKGKSRRESSEKKKIKLAKIWKTECYYQKERKKTSKLKD